MKILVPVDGSENSLRAARYALQMAKTHPSVEVTLLTVACFYDAGYISDSWAKIELLDPRCEEIFAKRLDEVKKIFEDEGVPVSTELMTGEPGKVIKSYVEEKNIDKVVMGSRGFSPFKAMILGSIAYKVLSTVKVPVTIIK